MSTRAREVFESICKLLGADPVKNTCSAVFEGGTIVVTLLEEGSEEENKGEEKCVVQRRKVVLKL